MTSGFQVACRSSGHELRFDPLPAQGCAYTFPCDAMGLVDIDALSERERDDYLFARATMGFQFARPVVLPVPGPPSLCRGLASS